jgi:two-component system, sporulation sensor kinase D
MIIGIFQNKWKVIIFSTAVLIAWASLWFTNDLVHNLTEEERSKIKIWAEANRELQETPLTGEVSLFLFKIISENKTIPRILVDNEGKIVNSMNLDPEMEDNMEYLKKELEIMKLNHEPIEIAVSDNKKNYIYYKDSILLTYLQYFPYFQTFVILLFLLVVYFALRFSHKAEQNLLWVGMSKETAHQLGTPISSLLAWVEILKSQEGKGKMIEEVSKDVRRLEKITERFSRIGSSPKLETVNICTSIENAVSYMLTRTSTRITYKQKFAKSRNVMVPLNVELFEWVIENLWKNSLDAMANSGEISINLIERGSTVYIDFSDTGKGIPKSKFKTVFKPGYTTKIRGWGLGLSLTKRIIETYHNGRIYVRNSEPGTGTTFRIVLFKNNPDLVNSR